MIVSAPVSSNAGLRLAELLGALSLATDLGMGQPMESVLLSTVLAIRLASTCNVDEDELSVVYYVALLRFVGCNADAHVAAETFGDELLARGHFAEADFGRPTSVFATLLRHLGASESPIVRARMLMTAFANMPRLYGTAVAHCEVGQLLADRFDLGPNVRQALFEVFERWDGRGMPRRLKGEQLAFAARLVPLATDAVVYHRLGGVDAALTMVRERSGGAYDPRLVEHFIAEADRLFLDRPREIQSVVEHGPHLAKSLFFQALK